MMVDSPGHADADAERIARIDEDPVFATHGANTLERTTRSLA